MPYLLIEDGFADNPKIMGLSDKAFRLHMSALVHCARNLTDGAISEISLRSSALISGIRRPNAVVNDLVKAGLWAPVDGGWRIHDYLKHNPSRAEIEAKRERTKIRKRRYDTKRNASGNASSNASDNASKDPPQETPTGSLLGRATPTGSPQRRKALAAAQAIATTWSTPDSDAFATTLDQIETEHGITFRALEREALWDTANTTAHNGHSHPAPELATTKPTGQPSLDFPA